MYIIEIIIHNKLEIMGYHKSKEEELLDSIIAAILEENDRNGGGPLSYNEVRAIAKDYQDLGKGTMMVKYRIIIGMLGTIGGKQVSVGHITIHTESIKQETNDDVLGKALLIMMKNYRSAFIRLMRQWGKNPEEYITLYKQHN